MTDNLQLSGIEILILKFLNSIGGQVKYSWIADHFCKEGRADDCKFLGPTLRDLRKERYILDELGPELTQRVYTITEFGKTQLKILDSAPKQIPS